MTIRSRGTGPVSARRTARNRRPLSAPRPPSRRTEPQAAQANGRMVATVTALDGELRMPAVEVELRTLDGNMTLARSRTDAIGQVMFPDVPPGRYIIRAQREGFEPSEVRRLRPGRGRDRAGPRRFPADVRPPQRRREGDERAELADVEHSPGVGERRAVGRADGAAAARRRRLPVAAAAAAGDRARRRRAAAHQGRPARHGRAAGEQRQPQRSVHRRFRPRAAG